MVFLTWMYSYTRSSPVSLPIVEVAVQDPWAVEDYVKGPPTKYFKDNLRNDTLYVTGFGDAGWTNDVMTFWNLVYIAMLTNRVPIIPPHVPGHLPWEAGTFRFGDIFDVPRFRRELGMPIIEWADVKTDEAWNDIGCWSPFATASKEGQPRYGPMMKAVKLDPSFTPTPENSNLWKERQTHSTFWGLAELGWPEERERGIKHKLPLPNSSQKTIYPDHQVLCFDFLYWVVNNAQYEWEKDHHPAWRLVGKHLHFNPKMVSLAENTLRDMWQLSAHESIPPFISVHVRHGDFEVFCDYKDLPVEKCYAPVSAFAQAVDEVRAELKQRKNIDVQRVIVTSDEVDPLWWSQIRAREKDGWYFLDDVAIQENHGPWYPMILDVVVQSMGTGFVGTSMSTMSMVALKRVREWNDGVGRMITWGEK
ncbi:hypothetical protein FRC02_004833 [Tulasnella sp. 418]|nr:hypothetical protein FRC02_004833 [Tulasnella sp. 418]